MDYYSDDEDFEGTPSQEWDVEELLEDAHGRKRRRLRDELERIDQQLEEREQVHEEAVAKLGSKLEWYKDRLETLYKQHRGKHGTRDEVKQKIEELYQELRVERRNRWRDRQELEMERREILRELEKLTDDSLEDLL